MLATGILYVLFACRIASALRTAAINQTSCKAVPDGEDWPSEEKWSTLNTLTGGRLIHPWPAAAVCHPGHPAYDAALCAVATTWWASSEFHASDPTSSLWTNVNNYSCLNDPDSPCTRDGFPRYVLNATTAEQIRIAVDWARENNVRVNVKSTGHDFLGR